MSEIKFCISDTILQAWTMRKPCRRGSESFRFIRVVCFFWPPVPLFGSGSTLLSQTKSGNFLSTSCWSFWYQIYHNVTSSTCVLTAITITSTILLCWTGGFGLPALVWPLDAEMWQGPRPNGLGWFTVTYQTASPWLGGLVINCHQFILVVGCTT